MLKLVKSIKKFKSNEYLIETESEQLKITSKEKIIPGDVIVLLNNNLCVKNKLRTYEGFKNYLVNIKSFGEKSVEKIINYYKENQILPHQIRYYFEKDFKNGVNHHLLNKKQKENYSNYLKTQNTKTLSEEEFIKENNLGISLVKKLKEKHINILEQFFQNPYEFSFMIKGIGFKTIDKIALQLKNKYDVFDEKEFRIMRLSSAIYYSLYEGEKQGHVYLAKTGIEYYLKTKLNIKESFLEEEFDNILNYLEKKTEIIVKSFKTNDKIKIIYLKKNFFMEEKVAKTINEKLEQSLLPIKIDNIKIPNGFQLSKKQEEAIYQSLKENLIIITGGPGTGKTTVAKYIYENLKYYFPNKKIKIMAPTGTAAKRIGMVINTKATTIHVGLKWKRGYFTYNEYNKLDADIVIIDESSMIDLPLFYNLLKSLDTKTKLILIGDKDQLPPVGIGKPFEDLLKSEVVPYVKLDKVYRQSNDNPIASFSEEVNNGNVNGDWRYKYIFRSFHEYKPLNIIIKRQYNKKENENYMSNLEMDIIDLFFDIYKNKKLDLLDIQILGIKNKGKGSVSSINEKIQDLLFPESSFISGTNFKKGDKVIQIFNNYNLNVMNGEMGIIASFDKENITVKFLEGNGEYKYITYSLNKQDHKNHAIKNLTLAYCITIHKSQGNEWKTVLILLNHFWGLNRKLLYTAITRSKEKSVILTNYYNLFTSIKTPFGLTDIEINGKKKLIQIKRNSLLDYKIKLYHNNLTLKI